MRETSWRGLEWLESRRLLSTNMLAVNAGTLSVSGVGRLTNSGGGVLILSGGTGTTGIISGTTPIAPALTSRGTLVVSGGDWDDIIGITRKGASLRIVQIDAEGEEHVSTFPFADVRRILVEGNAGHDKIAVRPTYHGPVTIMGGSGNDQLAGPQGATLIGGGGNDKLVCDVPDVDTLAPADVYGPGEEFDEGTPRKRGLLSGGDGNDVLLTWRYDTVIGGRGDDTVYLNHAGEPIIGQVEQLNFESFFQGHASGVEHFYSMFTVAT